MRNILIRLVAIFACIQPSANAVEVSKHLSTIIPPEPIVRIHPKYPKDAARTGREGWAVLSFVIDKEGSVGDVLIKETSGSKDFAKEAKKAVEKWQYKPAYENGKAIQQCINTVQMDFKMGKKGDKNSKGTTGVTKRFRNKYNKAREALKDKNYAEVERLLTLMQKNNYMHLSENNYMHLLAADYEKELGNKSKQLFHLNRAAKSNLRLGSDKQKLATLYSIFILELELNKLQSAHDTYTRLIKLSVAKAYLPKLEQLIAKVDAVIGGDKDIIRVANIKEKEYWSAALVRNEFSLVNIEGVLDTLDVRCANKRHVYTVEESNTWTLPASWKNCSIYVYGEPKSSFNLIEHPLKG